ncbi:MAG: Asp23/Gls24 family envelope stress response protein [Candidatus Omnitrophica bacterium]|nr:Asp23/Gls24 family envelope stress response protein [Candidatus Omnitrophota bacterium]
MDNRAEHRDRTTDLGIVRINNEAITTIASIAAMEVKGVHKMGGGIKRALCDIFSARTGAGGVKISVKESELRLTVSIIVDYGVDIAQVADEVQDNVKRAVEKMTGLVMSEVDVVVEGVYSAPLYDREKRKGGPL